MDRSAHEPDLNDVERAIRNGSKLLRFEPNLERRFETDTGALRCKHMIRQNYLGLIVYFCFLYSDYRVVGDAFYLDLFVHFCVVTPVVLLIHQILKRNPKAWVREHVQSVGVMVLTMTIVAVSAHSKMPDRDLVLLTITLVVLFAVIIQRIRLFYITAYCVLIQFCYYIGLQMISTASIERMVMSNSLVLGIIVFSLMASYDLESKERRGYLLALRDRLLNRDLELASLRDALTGLGNRRALDADMLRVTARRNGSRSTAVLLLDIDHFKAFNDTNGHQQGDVCLKRVAGLVAKSLREGEGNAYRFGGEEFLVMLADTTLPAALLVAERIRANIAGDLIPRDKTGRTVVTVSIGASCGNLDTDNLVARSDQALYTAKHRGRNQISPALSGTITVLDRDDRMVA